MLRNQRFASDWLPNSLVCVVHLLSSQLTTQNKLVVVSERKYPCANVYTGIRINHETKRYWQPLTAL